MLLLQLSVAAKQTMLKFNTAIYFVHKLMSQEFGKDRICLFVSDQHGVRWRSLGCKIHFRSLLFTHMSGDYMLSVLWHSSPGVISHVSGFIKHGNSPFLHSNLFSRAKKYTVTSQVKASPGSSTTSSLLSSMGQSCM